MGKHQALAKPELTWLDEGDGWTFSAASDFLDAMPKEYGGSVGEMKVGHASTAIEYRCKINEPVEKLGPGKFRVMRPVKAVNVSAVNAGDETYRATNRWGSLALPTVKGQGQTIEFPEVGELKGGEVKELGAKASSGLGVYYEVEYGPVVVKEGKVMVSELPAGAKLPIACSVTAYQMGRRVGPAVMPAAGVSRDFMVVGK